jgi:hypothetical protein
MPSRPLEFHINRSRIALVLDEHHLCHEGFAQELGLSRQYWSALYNRKRPLSPPIRARILACPRLAGIPESELWDVVPHADTRAA